LKKKRKNTFLPQKRKKNIKSNFPQEGGGLVSTLVGSCGAGQYNILVGWLLTGGGRDLLLLTHYKTKEVRKALTVENPPFASRTVGERKFLKKIKRVKGPLFATLWASLRGGNVYSE